MQCILIILVQSIWFAPSVCTVLGACRLSYALSLPCLSLCTVCNLWNTGQLCWIPHWRIVWNTVKASHWREFKATQSWLDLSRSILYVIKEITLHFTCVCILYYVHYIHAYYSVCTRPPLWPSDQSSWLQIQRFGFDSWHDRFFWEVVGLEQVHSASWVQLRNYLEEQVAASV
jgi:hypothetical protein